MEEKTDASKIILPDGTEWYDSTDLGYMDEDGFLYITGRTTRVIIKTDHKVSLDVVESKLKGIVEVSDAAVVPFRNENDDEEMIAFVVLKNKQITLSLDDLKDGKYNLTVFEVPDRLIIKNKLPHMNNGKVDYQTLEKEMELL